MGTASAAKGALRKKAKKKKNAARPHTVDNSKQYRQKRDQRIEQYNKQKQLNPPKVLDLVAKQPDFTLIFIILLLVLFGIVMIFSSSFYAALTKEAFSDMYYFFKRQLIWAVIGGAIMVIMINFDYHNLLKLNRPIYIIAIFFLVLVLFTADDINGSKRWLDFGFISFQPSELAKIAVIVFMSAFLTINKDKLKNFKGFLVCLLLIGLPVVLIAKENLSTAIVVIAVGFAIMFIANAKIFHFMVITIPVAVAGVLAVTLPQFAYRLTRVQAWLDPFSDPTDTGFQIVQSLYAVASGGLFGLGLGQSRQKLGYIPEAFNDIIFSIVCEELGFVGAVALLCLFMALVYKGVRIALSAPDMFGTLLATGITVMIGIQVIINVAVNTNTIPVTGMPLPFISYGGSSLAIIMASMGILLNISRYSKT